MRLTHWLATVVAFLPAMMGGGEALGQGPGPQAGPGGAPMETGEFPGETPFDAGAGPFMYDPPSHMIYPDYPYPAGTYPTNTPVPMQHGGTAIPPGANPWPQISPFDNAFDQHYQKDGLWYRFASNEFQRFVIVEGMATWFRRPSGAYIGDPTVDGNVFFAPGAQSAGFYPFAPANLRQRFDDRWDAVAGIKARLGHMNPDGSGVELTGWYGGIKEPTFTFGDPNLHPGDITRLRANNPGLPMQVPPGPSGVFSNVNAPYDMSVVIGYSTEAFGGSLTWYSSRAWDLAALKIRPIMGIRYMGLREKLTFHGRGSGQDITVSFPPGTTATGTGGPIAPPFEGSFHSVARNHLLGPEIGLRLDIGGETLKVINETKVAVAGVYEHISLDGKGLGNGLNPTYDPLRTFGNSERHGHISPVIEETISVEANVFGYVPVLKRIALFDRARVRVGYTFVWAAELQRPHSIRYLSPELGNPQIQFDRTEWYMHALNAGVSWEF